MILQALVDYYNILAQQGKISPLGWAEAKVAFALELNKQGQLIQVHPLQEEKTMGKKQVLAPRSMQVPVHKKRASNVFPYFLCDHSGYLLGVDIKGNPKRTAECFEACKQLHISLLEHNSGPAAQAIKSFFESWQPAQAAQHPALQESWEAVIAGGNLVFLFEGVFATQDAAVRDAWQQHYSNGGTGPVMQCLVTGQPSVIPNIHGAIKGIKDAQSAGAALISFNAPSLESYDRSQNLNAPVGEFAAFAYATALNQLIADRQHVQYIGDTAVLCWAASGESAYQDIAGMGMMGTGDDAELQSQVQATLAALAEGRAVDWNGFMVDPNARFYVLGLAPNAARLSVRFFWQNSFGDLAKNLNRHYEDLRLVRPAYDRWEDLPLWRLLSETVNQNSREKKPASQMAGDVLRAVLEGTRYPATLLNGAMLRIRAERDITRGRAAILKAYYLRNPHPLCPKEVLTVELNEQAQNIPYLLGRIFSVLEAIQQAANPNVNTTIKDKYFNSACATPANIFPLLLNLAQKHLRQLKPGPRIYWEKSLTELNVQIGQAFPTRMTLPEQGSFYLGYYFQTQKRFEKKEDK